MSNIIPGYNYDIFISYRQKDNKGDRWVSAFVEALKTELESTFKEEISVYFDINPQDGLLETHDVDASLKEKLKCLVFIPIISRTYCDPNSFAWEHEFRAFVEMATKDQFGLKVKLPNGNVAARVLPVQIHDIDKNDIHECELILNGALRGIEFIYKEPGVNRPLAVQDSKNENLNKTAYRNQVNKVTLAISEIFSGFKKAGAPAIDETVTPVNFRPASQEKSIIVLPFENISPDPEQEYFSDGLTEEIITDLSHIQDLLVISRSSAMTFKGARLGLKEIAEKVNVRYVLEGSVRKAGNSLRITAQLIDAENDMHIWSEKYSGTMDDVFDIQEKVSRSIADSLKIRLTSSQKSILVKPKISNSMAYEQYLLARNEIWRCSKDSLNHAIQILKNNLNNVGRNEYLLVSLAYAYYQFINIGIDPNPENLDRAEALTDEALQLNPYLSKAHLIKSFIHETRGNLKETMNSISRAIESDPNDPENMMMISFMYAWIGRPEKGEPYSKRAILIDPLNPLMYYGEWLINASLGRMDEALNAVYRMYNLDRENVINIHLYAYTLAMSGRIVEATELFDLMAKKYPDHHFTRKGRAFRFAINNQKQQALAEIDDNWKRAAELDNQVAYELAGLYSLLEEKAKAIHLIEKATRTLLDYPLLSRYDPFLENIRNEERFKEIMEQVKYDWENFGM